MKGKRLSHAFAPRIKKIMQADDDVGKIAQASPVLLGRALELFVVRLAEGMVGVAEEHNNRMLNPAHLKAYVNKDEVMDFLKQTVATAPDLAPDAGEEGKQKPKRRRKAEGDEGAASPKAPKARARTSKAKSKAEQQEPAAAEGIKAEQKEPPAAEGMQEEEDAVAVSPADDQGGNAGALTVKAEEKPDMQQEAAPGAPTAAMPHPLQLPVPPAAPLAEEDDYDTFE